MALEKELEDTKARLEQSLKEQSTAQEAASDRLSAVQAELSESREEQKAASESILELRRQISESRHLPGEVEKLEGEVKELKAKLLKAGEREAELEEEKAKVVGELEERLNSVQASYPSPSAASVCSSASSLREFLICLFGLSSHRLPHSACFRSLLDFSCLSGLDSRTADAVMICTARVVAYRYGYSLLKGAVLCSSLQESERTLTAKQTEVVEAKRCVRTFCSLTTIFLLCLLTMNAPGSLCSCCG